MKKISILIASVLLLCLGNIQTEAALIEITDNGSPGGINNITHDTVTGLEWLDLTASRNISYDAITVQFASGGIFEGWRHATKLEVETLLLTSANLTLGSQSVVDPLAVQFVGTFGVTQSNSLPDGTATRGLYNDDTSGSFTNISGAAFVMFGYPTIVNTSYTEVSILDDQPFPKDETPTGTTGHWLVRAAPIPEPATIVLFVFGSLILQRKKI